MWQFFVDMPSMVSGIMTSTSLLRAKGRQQRCEYEKTIATALPYKHHPFRGASSQVLAYDIIRVVKSCWRCCSSGGEIKVILFVLAIRANTTGATASAAT